MIKSSSCCGQTIGKMDVIETEAEDPLPMKLQSTFVSSHDCYTFSKFILSSILFGVQRLPILPGTSPGYFMYEY